MIKWHFIEITVNLMQIYMIYKTFDLYYERRFNYKYSIEVFIIAMTGLLSVLNYNAAIELHPYVYIAFFFLIYLTTILVFVGNIFSKAGTIFLLIAIIGTCELTSALLISTITGIEINSLLNQDFGRFEAMVISQTLLIYIYWLMKKKIDREKMNLLNNKYYLLVGSLLFLTVSMIVIVVWMYGNINNDNESVNTNLVLLTMCVSALSIVSIALTDNIIREMNEKHKNDLELQHMKMEHTYFSDVNSVLEEIRILRHDMRGELAIIHGYNEMNQRDKIRNHIEKKLSEMDIQLPPQIDKDNIITSFLNFKLKEASSKNIDVQIQSDLSEENEIYIDKEDICRILNNIINNAIEACMECNEKYIKLNIDMLGNCIIIKSENPFSGELNKDGDKILTVKKDKTRHGYGLKSIRNIAEKYGGFVKLNYDDNIFIVEVQMLTKL